MTLDKKSRVVVAMSGGVDSSVAAALLVEQGYDVIGMMMRLWSEDCDETGGEGAANRCCTPGQMADARRVADRLGIPFYVIDTQDVFRRTIVQFFIDRYAAGDTPNPAWSATVTSASSGCSITRWRSTRITWRPATTPASGATRTAPRVCCAAWTRPKTRATC